MPLNRGEGQTTRWYQQCFVSTSPNSSGDSDDSDIESVVLTPNTTLQELSPLSPPPSPPRRPPPPPSPPRQSHWDYFLPLPPLPDFVPPQRSLLLPPIEALGARFDIHLPPSQSHAIEGDQSECTMEVMNCISRVRISETDKNSHCPICMDEFKVDDQACQLPCSHRYCSECILRWLDNSKTCPVCRLQLNGCSSDSTNFNHGLESQPEIPPPSSQPEVLPPPYSPDGNADEGDYDSACDEFGDSHEDGASQSASAPLT